METKTCFKCHKTKPLSEFYKHPMMSDGHLGKCKQCAKVDVAENYDKNFTNYRAYEAERSKRPERKRSAQ